MIDIREEPGQAVALAAAVEPEIGDEEVHVPEEKGKTPEPTPDVNGTQQRILTKPQSI